MKLMTIVLTLLVHGMLTSGYALSLDAALQSAYGQPAVVTAEEAVIAAQSDLARINADPYALTREVFQAEQRLALSQAQARQALYNVVNDIGNAYAAVLLAELEEQLAVANEGLNQLYAETTQARKQNGEATVLEVRDVEATLGTAVANRRSAAETVAVRRSALRRLLSAEVAGVRLEPIPNARLQQLLPSVHELISSANATADLVYARQAVALAKLDVDLSDLRYSAARNVETAETQLAEAETTLATATRSRHEQLHLLYAQVEAARRLHRAQEVTSAVAQQRLVSQHNRFLRGAVSETELQQARYAAIAAQLEQRRAKHNLFTSLLSLQTAAATNLLTPRESVGAARDAERVQWVTRRQR